MLENFIYVKTKFRFNQELEAGNILDEAIVFIEDTKEIWNHGTYFDGSTIDLSSYTTEEELTTALANYLPLSGGDLTGNLYAPYIETDEIFSASITGEKIYGTWYDDNSNRLSWNETSIGVYNDDGAILSVINSGDGTKYLADDGSYKEITIPTKTSELTNDSNFTTTSDVETAIANLVDSAPDTLNTLNELATAIQEHQEVTDALDAAITNKADKTEIPTKVSQLLNDVPYVIDSAPANGVYAVAADGSLISVDEADESCIAVALVQGEHQFMIEKNGEANTTSIQAAHTADRATNTSYTYFYWGMYGSDNASITNFTQTGGGGTSYSGYLPKADGTYQSTPNLSGDYTTWTTGALSDFNGKANTAAIQAASDTDSYTTYANMGTWCTKFNETASENQGYTDWYIPACGQLSLMYLNMTEINSALTKIGGTTLASGLYWSSSEYSGVGGWLVDFRYGHVYYGNKGGGSRVRFVRDLSISVIDRISTIENNYVTTDTDQTISGSKTITGILKFDRTEDTNGTNYLLMSQNALGSGVIKLRPSNYDDTAVATNLFIANEVGGVSQISANTVADVTAEVSSAFLYLKPDNLQSGYFCNRYDDTYENYRLAGIFISNKSENRGGVSIGIQYNGTVVVYPPDDITNPTKGVNSVTLHGDIVTRKYQESYNNDYYAWMKYDPETNVFDIRALEIPAASLDYENPIEIGDVQINGKSIVTEAPADSTLYARMNNTWAPVSGLEDLVSYGIKWQKEATSPICTRIGNPLLHKELPIQSLYKGCIYDFATSAFKYWLDPNDWSLKADGTASVLDGTDGDVCVHTPKFYGKSGETDDWYWVRISTMLIDSTWVEIPEMYIGAYRSTVDRTNSLARSIINTNTQYRGGLNNSSYDTYLDTDVFRTLLGKPATNISRANMRTYCRNNNSEMLSYEQYKWIFYWAYAIEYANFNCLAAYNADLTSDGYRQGGLGNGVTTWNDIQWNLYNYYNPITPCGYGNDMGNFTGIKTISIPAQTGRDGSTAISAKTFNMPRWRGFDNPFGDIWTNLDGIIILGYVDDSGNPSYKEVYTTSDPANYGDTSEYVSKMKVAGIEIYQSGYILEFDLGETAEIIPSKNGASTTIGKCDYHWVLNSSDTNYTNLRGLLVGGRANDGGGAGFGGFNSHNGVGGAWMGIGFRLVKTVD